MHILNQNAVYIVGCTLYTPLTIIYNTSNNIGQCHFSADWLLQNLGKLTFFYPLF